MITVYVLKSKAGILIAASALMVAATVVHAESHIDLIAHHCDITVESYVDATRQLEK